MKKYFWCCICFLLVAPVFLYPQTAQKIENLLNTETLTYEEAASLVLEAADFSDLSDPAAAFGFALEQEWLPREAAPGGAARLDGISLLVMRSFGIKGGLMYTLFKNSHYAYREFVYHNIIQGRADPGMTVSGEYLLFMIGRLFSITDSDPEALPKERRERERQALLNEINARLNARALSGVTVKLIGEGVTISLANMRFVANSAELEDTAELGEIAEMLKAFPARKIVVAGHTALAGTPEDRLQTSTQRAQAVADFLVAQGARRADEIEVRGYGAERSIADNSTPEGMSRNRRVEITILD